MIRREVPRNESSGHVFQWAMAAAGCGAAVVLWTAAILLAVQQPLAMSVVRWSAYGGIAPANTVVIDNLTVNSSTAMSGTATLNGAAVVNGVTSGGGLAASGNTLGLSSGTANGQVKAWNGTSWVTDDYGGDPSLMYLQVEEFLQFTTSCTSVGALFIGTASGTGAGCQVTQFSTGHPGIINLHAGTTGTGFARFRTNAGWQLGGNSGPSCVRSLIYWPQLSTATNQFLTRIGWMTSLTNAQSTDSIVALYDHANNGDVFALETCKTSVCAVLKCDGTGGTINEPIVANTWYTTEECQSSDGLTATLAINGTICASTTTDVTTGALGVGALNTNNSGSVPADVGFYIDYMSLRLPFSVAR